MSSIAITAGVVATFSRRAILSTRLCWRVRSLVGFLLLACGVFSFDCFCSGEGHGGQRASEDTGVPVRPNHIGKDLLLNIVDDQKAIWTSPARLRFKDMKWIVPLGGLTAGLIAFDSDIFSQRKRAYGLDFSGQNVL